MLQPYVDRRGFTVGKDFFLVYSPEREDPGNAHFNTQTILKIVGWTTPACAEAGSALYGHAVDKVVQVSSTQVAELTKTAGEHPPRVNIGLVNEMKTIADKMNIDIFEVIDAARGPSRSASRLTIPGLGSEGIASRSTPSI